MQKSVMMVAVNDYDTVQKESVGLFSHQPHIGDLAYLG